MGIVQGAIVLSGNCPGAVVRGAISLGRNYPRDNFLGGDCQGRNYQVSFLLPMKLFNIKEGKT